MEMMFSNPIVTTIKDIVRVNRRHVYIDNVIFRLHYRWTVIFLSIFSILVTSRQHFGDPIDCLSSGDVKKITDQYCWIHSTFTRGKYEKGKWRYEAVKENEIHPGIQPANRGDELIYHTYYQWVWCVLLIQACLFYMPHWIWEKLEGGTTKMLVSNLNLPMLPEEKKTKHRKAILNYFKPNKGYHTMYAFQHFSCEILNLLNILSQIYTTDYFLNNEFSKYGIHIFDLTQTRPYLRNDTLSRVFPTVTACRIATGGVAFGVVHHDVLCVMPLNILNEKIYIFLWFLFLLVAFASILGILYRLLTFGIPWFRKYLLKRRARIFTEDILNIICVNCSYGDWFLIYKLGQNMDKVAFSAVLKELAESFYDIGKSKTSLNGSQNIDPTEKGLLEVEVNP